MLTFIVYNIRLRTVLKAQCLNILSWIEIIYIRILREYREYLRHCERSNIQFWYQNKCTIPIQIIVAQQVWSKWYYYYYSCCCYLLIMLYSHILKASRISITIIIIIICKIWKKAKESIITVDDIIRLFSICLCCFSSTYLLYMPNLNFGVFLSIRLNPRILETGASFKWGKLLCFAPADAFFFFFFLPCHLFLQILFFFSFQTYTNW